ncbi:uncharacterized protein [Branchiostoma lanceolatum]|uniref:uncharacterized protein n=1 Tax=Branchiostoma lanceolatum TaxID=7740 RepID=UPI003455F6CF
MAPVVSKLASVFPADQMISLLKQIDENVRLIVHSMRGLGAEVRQKVGGLLQKYLTLLTETLRECMYLKNFIQILHRNLGDVKNNLTVVRNGTVSEVLEDLHLQRYLSNFESKDLRSAHQLIKPTFDVELVDLPTAAAKEAIQDRIQELRHELGTTKDRIHEVKENGESCWTSCKEITKKFSTFLQEIKKTQEDISSLLVEHRNESSQICLASFVVLGISVVLLTTCVGGAVAACCAAFTSVAISVELTGGLAISSGILGSLAGMTAWGLHQKKKEMETIGTALEKLQEQLAAMDFDAGKQKTEWEKIETQAEKIFHYINTSKMEETADGLNPSHRRPVQDLLEGVQVVLDDAAKLQTNVVQFEREAEQVQQNLRDLSLIKSDAVLATPTKAASASPLQPLYDGIVEITKTVQKWGSV